MPGNLRDARHQLLHVLAQQRFAAREADFLDAQARRDAHHALDFLKGQDVRRSAAIAARWAWNAGSVAQRPR